MRKWLRRLIFSLLILIGVLLVLVVVAWKWAQNKYLSPEGIVRELEKGYNVRAQVAGTSLDPFKKPATLLIKGLRLFPRDAVADSGIALSKRPAIPDASAKLAGESVSMELELLPMLWRFVRGKSVDLDVEKFVAEGMDLRLTVNEAGFPDVQALFDKPDTVNGKPNPKKIKRPGQKKDIFSLKGKGLAELSGNLPLLIGVAGIRNTRLYIQRDDEKMSYLLEHLNFQLEDVDLDSNDIANHNHLVVRSSYKMTVQDLAKNEMLANATMDVNAPLRPFDPKTQLFNPQGRIDVTVNKGSQFMKRSLEAALDEYRISQEGKKHLSDKAKSEVETINEIKSLGMKLQSLEVGGELLSDMRLLIKAEEGGYTLQNEPVIAFKNFTAKAFPGSSFNGKNNDYTVDWQLILDHQATREAKTGMEKYLESKGGILGKFFAPDLFKQIQDEQGRVSVKLQHWSASGKDGWKPVLGGSLFKKLESFGIKMY